jgi:hypothetical protein
MQDQVNATSAPKRVPWNKGKLTGAKPPLRPIHVWSIRTKATVQLRGRPEILGAAGTGRGALNPRAARRHVTNLRRYFRMGIVLRGDQFDGVSLPTTLVNNCAEDLSIIGQEIGCACGHHLHLDSWREIDELLLRRSDATSTAHLP